MAAPPSPTTTAGCDASCTRLWVWPRSRPTPKERVAKRPAPQAPASLPATRRAAAARPGTACGEGPLWVAGGYCASALLSSLPSLLHPPCPCLRRLPKLAVKVKRSADTPCASPLRQAMVAAAGPVSILDLHQHSGLVSNDTSDSETGGDDGGSFPQR